VRPSAAQAAKKPDLAAVRTALIGTVPGAIVGPSFQNLCSPEADVRVPLRGTPARYRTGKLVLKTSASSYEGVTDKDKLALTCLPAS
jgi:hypothetical protein